MTRGARQGNAGAVKFLSPASPDDRTPVQVRSTPRTPLKNCRSSFCRPSAETGFRHLNSTTELTYLSNRGPDERQKPGRVKRIHRALLVCIATGLELRTGVRARWFDAENRKQERISFALSRHAASQLACMPGEA